MLLVTGASGFLGSAITRLAISRGLNVRAMVHRETSLDLLQGLPLMSDSIVFGEMTERDTLESAAAGVSVVIHCAATTSEMAPDLELSRRVNVQGTHWLLDACRHSGVRRFIQISSQSAHSKNRSVYGRTKMEADEHVRASSTYIDWTILKPSIIYGPQKRGVFYKMVNTYRKLPVIPIFGSGDEEMRPVHVDDVAWAALACLDEPKTIHRIYDLGGADVMKFNDFVSELLKALGQEKMRVHVPLWAVMLGARILSRIMKNPPVTPDNVRGIQTVRHVDICAAQRDFGFAPRAFADGLQEVVQLFKN